MHGFVVDENGNPIERASVKVKSRDVSFSTTKYGEFWRILLPGVYKLEVRRLEVVVALFDRGLTTSRVLAECKRCAIK